MGGPCSIAAPKGIARVRAACFEYDESLPYASEEAGDLALENSVVRYVIRARSEHGLMIMGTGSGSLIDAIPVVDGSYVRSRDGLQELIAFPGLRTLRNPKFTYETGPPGDPAFIRVEAEILPVPIADSVLPGMGVQGKAILTWSLQPDSTVLDLSVLIVPDETNKITPIMWFGLLFSGSLNGWTDEAGIAREPGGTGVLYAGISSDVSLGVHAESGLSFVEAGGLILAMVGTENDGPKNVANANIKFAAVPGNLDKLYEAFELDFSQVLGLSLNSENPFPEHELLLDLLDADGKVVNRTTLTNEAEQSVQVPEKATHARIRWLNGPEGELTELTGQENLALDIPAVSEIKLQAQSSETQIALPARAILQNELGQQYHATIGVLAPEPILVNPGTYTVSFSRGHEYEVSIHEDVKALDGESISLMGSIDGWLDTKGWVACDFHLHSDFSTDSADPLKRRILEVAAEGVEFAVSTDHDFVVDYGPLRDLQGLQPFLQVTNGVEMSNPELTHASSFPWAVHRELSGQGAPNWHTLPPSELFSLLGMDDPNRVFQMNHPRGSTGYHDSIKYNPVTGKAERLPNQLGLPADSQLAGFKYDAMEIYNGKRSGDIAPVFTDWLSFLAQGVHIAGTGTSDSHHSGAYPGAARTYVWVGEEADGPAGFDVEAIKEGVHKGHTMVVGGPFVEAWLLPDEASGDSPTIAGQVQSTATTTARVRVKVQAPTWMPVDEIQIWRNQEEIISESLGSPNAVNNVIRLDQTYEIEVTKDSFFVVVVKGNSIPYPHLKNQIISFAGPLFLNMDGDEIYSPPGLMNPAD